MEDSKGVWSKVGAIWTRPREVLPMLVEVGWQDVVASIEPNNLGLSMRPEKEMLIYWCWYPWEMVVEKGSDVVMI